jgi:hypothetical protein
LFTTQLAGGADCQYRSRNGPWAANEAVLNKIRYPNKSQKSSAFFTTQLADGARGRGRVSQPAEHRRPLQSRGRWQEGALGTS